MGTVNDRNKIWHVLICVGSVQYIKNNVLKALKAGSSVTAEL